MKKFETPVMDVEKLDVMDVIATSEWNMEEEPA